MESEIMTPTIEAALQEASKEIAKWINYSWDGLSDRDISGRFPDWAYNGIGSLGYQGGKPGLCKLSRVIVLAFLRKMEPSKGMIEAAVGEIGPSETAVFWFCAMRDALIAELETAARPDQKDAR